MQDFEANRVSAFMGVNGPVITMASAEEGTDRSWLAANLAVLQARKGSKVLLVDGSGQLGQYISLVNEPNIIMTGMPLSATAEAQAATCDVALIDAGHGSSEELISLYSPRQQTILLLTASAEGIGKAYGMIKTLCQRAAITDIGIIVNQVTDARDALRAFVALRGVVSQFTDAQLEYLGNFDLDEKIGQSMSKRKILLDLYPGVTGIACLEVLEKRLETKGVSS